MLQLSQDHTFHFEALRALGRARYDGADVAEILSILDKIKPGDTEAWYREWRGLALRVLSAIDEEKVSSYSAVTVRSVYFRASTYFFVSDLFIHGDPQGTHSDEAFRLWRKYFDKANALLSSPGQYTTVDTGHGFTMPAIVYKAPEASATNPRPTMILTNGFDSNMEETLHIFGFAALERGYNVVLYEGPGQPSLIHQQQKGFIHDWEKAVTPLVDHLIEHREASFPFIDTVKLGLLGYSLGGYLVERAAAFEPRIAAIVCIDGVYSFRELLWRVFPDCGAAFERGDRKELEEHFSDPVRVTSTNIRWIVDHLKFSCCTRSAWEVFEEMSKMEIGDIAHRINCPAFIGEAEEDQFFLGQPQRLVDAIGPHAELVKFSTEQAAGAHCAAGAAVYQNQRIYEWFAKVVSDKE